MNAQSQVSAPRVLFVDDEQAILNSLKRFARANQWCADFASSGSEALELAAANDYELILSDMRMPEMSGADLLNHMQNNHPKVKRVLLTGYSDIEALEKVINESGIYSYVTKPWNELVLRDIVENGIKLYRTEREQERLQTLTQSQNKKLGKVALLLNKQLKESAMETQLALSLLDTTQSAPLHDSVGSLSILTSILEWREGEDAGHISFVEQYAPKVAAQLDHPQLDTHNLLMAAKLHRIGMIGLPDELKQKPQYKLSQEQREVYCQHPLWAQSILNNDPAFDEVGKIIRHHREYINGSGFPDNLIDKEIPIESKVICVLGDFIDVLKERKEKNVSGLGRAKDYINAWKGKRYDSQIVDVLWEVLKDFEASNCAHKTVDFTNIKSGQVLAKDILTSSGILLLRKGAKITEDTIEHLKRHEEKFKEKIDIVIEAQQNKQESED